MVQRFDYAKFLECAALPSVDSLSPLSSRRIPDRVRDRAASAYSPVTFIPAAPFIACPLSNAGATSGRASSIDEPIFLCVVDKVQASGSRIDKMLKNLSQLGRVIVESDVGATNVQIRRLVRRFLSLTENTRATPIYLVGFGSCCDVLLTAAATSPQLLPPSNGGALEDIICGRLASLDAPPPLKPWLAGLILIAPPPTTYRFDELGSLDSVVRRCSLLLVISSKYQKEATAFREALIAARKRSMVYGVGVFRGNDWKPPCEFDLRMLVIGGSDHLLRMHPSILRRFATTQSAIDFAINIAIKNLVAVCRSLVNTNAAPMSTHGSNTTGISHEQMSNVGSNGSAFPPPRFTKTSKTQEARKGTEALSFSRKAAILRGGTQSRNYTERHQVPQLRIAGQRPAFPQYDEHAKIPGRSRSHFKP
ncbi:unnamed protein product [Mesocestoides corti]|nr:unnamed protein product [Mesocestoides corti]